MPGDGTVNSPIKIALQAVAAAAGLGAAVTFVGGVVVWLRLEHLGLAADQAVALLPKELLVVVGAHALALPIVVGALAALALSLIGSNGPDTVTRSFMVALAGVVVAALVLVALVVDGFDVPHLAIVIVAVAIGVVVIHQTAKRSALRRHIAQVVLVAFTACGIVIAIVAEIAKPEMEPVAVLLTGEKAVNGFYVGQTSDRLYVAPLPGLGDPGDPFADAKIDRVVELRREDVVRMALRGPTSIATDGEGRQQAQTLLADLRVQYAGSRPPAKEQVVTTVSPETAFAPLVHLDAKEPAWPMSADAFLRNAWLMWGHDECPDYSVALATHLDKPQPRRAQIMGRFDRTRLAGANAYRHAPADAKCRDGARAFSAADHTRAFDAKARAAGLPAKDGFYLDLWDTQRRGEPKLKKEGSQEFLQRVPVYFERSAEKDGLLRITYWLFYGLSIPPGPAAFTKYIAHEGDWERVSILLRPGAEPGQYVPISVRYHYHDESRDVPWDAVDRVGTGSDAPTHPVAFSARGSHASYPRAGRYENVFKAGGVRRFAVQDIAMACNECPQWRTWQMLVDARAQPWYGFGGAWGRAGSIGGTTGPLGPSRYKIRGLGPAPENALDSGRPVANAGR